MTYILFWINFSYRNISNYLVILPKLFWRAAAKFFFICCWVWAPPQHFDEHHYYHHHRHHHPHHHHHHCHLHHHHQHYHCHRHRHWWRAIKLRRYWRADIKSFFVFFVQIETVRPNSFKSNEVNQSYEEKSMLIFFCILLWNDLSEWHCWQLLSKIGHKVGRYNFLSSTALRNYLTYQSISVQPFEVLSLSVQYSESFWPCFCTLKIWR